MSPCASSSRLCLGLHRVGFAPSSCCHEPACALTSDDEFPRASPVPLQAPHDFTLACALFAQSHRRYGFCCTLRCTPALAVSTPVPRGRKALPSTHDRCLTTNGARTFLPQISPGRESAGGHPLFCGGFYFTPETCQSQIFAASALSCGPCAGKCSSRPREWVYSGTASGDRAFVSIPRHCA